MTAAAATPRFAAIVNNYNYESFIAAAVDSVLEQTVPFDEVIVVDDGSTDGSRDVLRGYLGRIRVIEKTNGGQLSAVWAAVRETECDFVYVLDSDDVADRDLVAKVRPLLTSNPVKVQFQLHSMQLDGAPIDSIFPSYAPGYTSAAMVADNERLGFYVCPPTSGNVFQRNYLASLATVELNEREAFDGVPAQLAPYYGEILSMNVPLARYRVHEDSDSQWGRPTQQLLQKELDRFNARWAEVLEVLRREGKPLPSTQGSVFVTERALMIAVLEGRRPTPAMARAYANQVLRSGIGAAQRAFFSGWAYALVVLPNAAARSLVISRRSARKRGRVLTAVARMARARSSS